jgi:hypothetical protein
VVLVLIGLAIAAAVAIVLLLANEPSPPKAPCTPRVPCVLSRNPAEQRLGKLWVSRDLGYSFEYPNDVLGVSSQDGKSVQLEASSTSGLDIQIWITGARAGGSSVEKLGTERRNALAQRVLGLSEDNNSADRVMAPGLGFVRGAGSGYTGTLDSPTGPSSPANLAILAAGNGKINVVLSILITGKNLDPKTVQDLREQVGVVIVNTLRYR